jgi:hypothetical protein
LPDIFLGSITNYVEGIFEEHEGVLPVPVQGEASVEAGITNAVDWEESEGP